MENGTAIVSLENVVKTYPTGTEALKGINLKIEKGEFVFVVGTSGSGKSTFIKLLLREIEPTGGTLMVNGKDITHLKHRQVAEHRRGIGCVFQDFRLLKEWNVYENVAFAQKVVGVPNRLIGRNVHKILALVGLEDKVNAYPRELSGGEQQRVALARALVNEPAMLIADEPTGNLDPKNSIEIMNLLDTINKQGTTVIVVTHNHEIVNSMKKRVITLHKGELIKDEIGGTYRQETDVRPDLIQTIEQEVKEMDSVQETPVAEPLYSAEEPVLEEEEQQIPDQEGIEVKLDDTTSWVEAFEEKDKEEVLYSPLELAMRRGRKNRS